MNNPSQWTLVSSNPTDTTKWRILATNLDGSITAFSIALSVVIEFDTLFLELKNEPPSLAR